MNDNAPRFIQGNSSASKPDAHMPITFAEEGPGDTWSFAAWFWLAVTVIATLAFFGAIAFTAGALLRAHGFI